MDQERKINSWISLVGSIISIFTFITGIDSLPTILGSSTISNKSGQVQSISLILGKSLSYVAFFLVSLLLLAISYWLSLSIRNTFFGGCSSHGVIEGIIALGILVIFTFTHSSLFEIWWGFKQLNLTVMGDDLKYIGGLLYFCFNIFGTLFIIEESNLYPTWTVFSRFVNSLSSEN